MVKSPLPIAVLAGGLGTRLKPLTQNTSKIMLTVAGKPFIAHLLECFKKQDLEEVVLCVGQWGGKIKAFVKDGSRWGLKVTYSSDGEHLLGTGGAIRKALPHLGPAFFVQYGDTLLLCNYKKVTTCFIKSSCKGLMTLNHNRNRWDKSNVIFKDGKILQYNKEPRLDEMEHIDYGLLAFKKEAFVHYPENKRLDLSTVCQDLITAQQFMGLEVTEKFYEIGTIAAKKRTERFLR